MCGAKSACGGGYIKFFRCSLVRLSVHSEIKVVLQNMEIPSSGGSGMERALSGAGRDIELFHGLTESIFTIFCI